MKWGMKRKLPVKVLIESLNEQYCVLGSINRSVRSVYPIDQADDDSLCFYRRSDERALEMIRSSKAAVIVCSDNLKFSEGDYQDKTIIQVANPRLTYSRLLNKYFHHRPKPKIHPSDVIDEKARIGKEVYIGPCSYIGDCEIGEGTIIEGCVYINDGTKIGKHVIIHPNVIIGTAAISFERNENGRLEWFPQIGGVIIEDDVEIGANSHIARGPLPRSETIIGEGTKLDVLVEVGHGVRIGKHCIIVGHTSICGRVTIGDYTMISSMVGIREGITIGNRVMVGMGSTVLEDIPDNLVVFGTPAKPIRKNVL
jgi:UDP-3-O-[3-hydroxymyristoyl] glucosamine N-acyltransferase